MTDEEIQAIVNPFTNYCGIEIHKDERDGSYYLTAEWKPEYTNPYGYFHGGYLFTLADTTAGYNARRYTDGPVTLDCDFHYLNNAKAGKIICRAETIRTGRKILVFRVTITSDTGKKLAEGTVSYYNTQEA